jgi:hypothetical protein
MFVGIVVEKKVMYLMKNPTLKLLMMYLMYLISLFLEMKLDNQATLSLNQVKILLKKN